MNVMVAGAGLGHAVLCARQHIGNEPFTVLLGDDIVFSDVPCTQQLIDQHLKCGASVVAVEHVAPSRISDYGVVKVRPGAGRLREVEGLVEKPSLEEAPSDLGMLGRYVLTPSIFDAIERTLPGRRGEVQLTDAIALLRETEPVYSFEFDGRRFDLGNRLDWLKANIEVALGRKEYEPELRPFLSSLVREGAQDDG